MLTIINSLTRVFISVHQFAIEKRQWYPRPPFRGPRGCQSPSPGSHRIGTEPTKSANPDDHNMPASVYAVGCAENTFFLFPINENRQN